jgi:hypothetical protein
MVAMFFYLGMMDEKLDHPFESTEKQKKQMAPALRRLIGMLIFVLFFYSCIVVAIIAFVIYIANGQNLLAIWWRNGIDTIENYMEGKNLQKI